MKTPPRQIRIEWPRDDTDYATHLGNGAVYVLRTDEPSEHGIYLPDGTWKPISPERRPIGF